jgi:hypothetical protein
MFRAGSCPGKSGSVRFVFAFLQKDELKPIFLCLPDLACLFPFRAEFVLWRWTGRVSWPSRTIMELFGCGRAGVAECCKRKSALALSRSPSSRNLPDEGRLGRRRLGAARPVSIGSAGHVCGTLEAGACMRHAGDGRPFLGIGQEAPPPSGPEDPELKAAMLAQSRAYAFRMRVNLWCWLTMHGRFDWQGFEERLESSEFRSYTNANESIQSLGWAGRGATGAWLFGVLGYRLWFYGKSAMRHELFHAVQDYKVGLFDRKSGLLRSLGAEYSAHLWGGPLIGVPLAYGGTLFIVAGISVFAWVLAGLF